MIWERNNKTHYIQFHMTSHVRNQTATERNWVLVTLFYYFFFFLSRHIQISYLHHPHRRGSSSIQVSEEYARKLFLFGDTWPWGRSWNSWGGILALLWFVGICTPSPLKCCIGIFLLCWKIYAVKHLIFVTPLSDGSEHDSWYFSLFLK